MAQFVQIKYGHYRERNQATGKYTGAIRTDGMGGSGQGYTYIVDDTQRTGNYLSNVPFRHHKSGQICFTGGTILSRRKSLERKITAPRANAKNPYSLGQDKDTINAELVDKFGSAIGSRSGNPFVYKMKDSQSAQYGQGGNIKTIPYGQNIP